MVDFIYQILQTIGYNHPIHPPVTHIPVGLIIGGFLFSVGAIVFKRSGLAKTARHCFVLALIALPVAVVLGFLDWQHYFAGAWLLPIKMKLILAAVLAVFLSIAIFRSRQTLGEKKNPVAVYTLCLLTVVSIGFFGGELVYGKKQKTAAIADGLARQGAAIFNESCALCHYTDSNETKIGPGLKGLFKQQKLPFSGKPVSEDSVRQQLKAPVENMPAFANLEDAQVDALLAYLKSL